MSLMFILLDGAQSPRPREGAPKDGYPEPDPARLGFLPRGGLPNREIERDHPLWDGGLFGIGGNGQDLARGCNKVCRQSLSCLELVG